MTLISVKSSSEVDFWPLLDVFLLFLFFSFLFMRHVLCQYDHNCYPLQLTWSQAHTSWRWACSSPSRKNITFHIPCHAPEAWNIDQTKSLLGGPAVLERWSNTVQIWVLREHAWQFLALNAQIKEPSRIDKTSLIFCLHRHQVSSFAGISRS